MLKHTQTACCSSLMEDCSASTKQCMREFPPSASRSLPTSRSTSDSASTAAMELNWTTRPFQKKRLLWLSTLSWRTLRKLSAWLCGEISNLFLNTISYKACSILWSSNIDYIKSTIGNTSKGFTTFYPLNKHRVQNRVLKRECVFGRLLGDLWKTLKWSSHKKNDPFSIIDIFILYFSIPIEFILCFSSTTETELNISTTL